jgi:predicted DNA-binding transcriptional regulator AlpA
MSPSVTAAQVVVDPARVVDVDPAGLPALLAQLTTAAAAVAARLSTIEPPNAPQVASGGDRLLMAKEASVLLNLSTDWLYKSEAARPFRVRIGSEVRFSSTAIQRFIERHRGR